MSNGLRHRGTQVLVLFKDTCSGETFSCTYNTNSLKNNEDFNYLERKIEKQSQCDQETLLQGENYHVNLTNSEASMQLF